MDVITKIGELKTPSTEKIKTYFEELKYSESEQFSRCCELVYCGHQFDLDPEVVKTAKDIDMSFISWYQNGAVFAEVKEAIKELTERFEIKYLWVMAYPPKDKLSFHSDNFVNRHSLTFNHDPKFYNYEFLCDNNPGTYLQGFNDNFNLDWKTLDDFNEYFLGCHENCQINALDPQSIYTFGDTIHAFANDSEDKVRFNFIFEIRE